MMQSVHAAVAGVARYTMWTQKKAFETATSGLKTGASAFILTVKRMV